MPNAQDRVEELLHKIDSRYDAENDLGSVTWADATLYDAILELAAELDELEQRIINLERAQ